MVIVYINLHYSYIAKFDIMNFLFANLVLAQLSECVMSTVSESCNDGQFVI